MKYKLERQLRKFNNMIKSKKLLKAKELEEMDDEYNPNLQTLYFSSKVRK